MTPGAAAGDDGGDYAAPVFFPIESGGADSICRWPWSRADPKMVTAGADLRKGLERIHEFGHDAGKMRHGSSRMRKVCVAHVTSLIRAGKQETSPVI